LLLGVLCLNYKQRQEFGGYDQRLIKLVANHGVDLLAEAEFVRTRERKLFQAGVHNSVKSQMSALLLRMQEVTPMLGSDHPAIHSLHQVQRIAERVLSDSDLLIKTTQTGKGLGQTLQEAFGAELERIAGPSNFGTTKSPVTFHSRGLAENLPELPLESVSVIQAILREGVLNALRHARYQHVTVRVMCTACALRLVVEDDGQGFDPTTDWGQNHRGIKSMYEEAETIKGDLRITRRRGRGMRLQLTVPL
jgi:signal transduction histidine kinase